MKTATATRQWKWLEAVHRCNGDVVQIRIGSNEAAQGVEAAAGAAGITVAEAWEALRRGESLTTCSFIRRLAE